MPSKLTLDEFKRKARLVHGDLYDYTDTVLSNGSKSKIVYICKHHGEVEQLANNHLQGKGCGWCSGVKKLTPEMVKARIHQKHGDRYQYGDIDYDDLDCKVSIGCLEHGLFKQSLRNHMEGKGCPLCGMEVTHNNRRLTTEDFIAKAIEVHGNRYDYALTVYHKSSEKVVITCPEHGAFIQDPHSHLKGSGCPKCGIKSRVLKVQSEGAKGWRYSDWEKAGEKSKQFRGFSLYIIECISEKERFIKVGKTYTDIGVRFKTLPYKFKVITQVYHNAYAISVLEQKIHAQLKEFTYLPAKDFPGKYECYGLEAKMSAVNLAESTPITPLDEGRCEQLPDS